MKARAVAILIWALSLMLAGIIAIDTAKEAQAAEFPPTMEFVTTTTIQGEGDKVFLRYSTNGISYCFWFTHEQIKNLPTEETNLVLYMSGQSNWNQSCDAPWHVAPYRNYTTRPIKPRTDKNAKAIGRIPVGWPCGQDKIFGSTGIRQWRVVETNDGALNGIAVCVPAY